MAHSDGETLESERPDEDSQHELQLVAFRHADVGYYRGSWQDRAVAPSPFDGVRFSYFNNSRTMQNSNVLQVILREHGFQRTEAADADWNIFWCAGQVDPLALRILQPHQRVNKFPKASCLTLKSNLWSNFVKMQRRFGSAHFGYMPPTFLVPQQLDQLEACLEDEAHRSTVWIVKPAAAYCGRGIALHRSRPTLAHDLRSQKGVCSVYIDPPFLLDGLKSDIRLYVLVSSWHPLVVYLYEEGLARFATEAYSLDTLDQRCCHLTNYSLNKHSKHFVHSSEEDSGSKWSLSAFRRRLQAQVGDVKAEEVWKQVDDIIVKTAISVEGLMSEALRTFLTSAAEGRPNEQCFQLFGFDVMLDGDATPWLLEVNLDPALRTESPLDLKVKSAMLVDLLNLVGVPVPAATELSSSSAADADAAPCCGAAEASMAAASACDGDSAAALEERGQAILRHVNAEYGRSRKGGWRRLFPSARSREYLPLLDPKHTLHSLPFDV